MLLLVVSLYPSLHERVLPSRPHRCDLTLDILFHIVPSEQG